MRILDFVDGFESSTPPTSVGFSSSEVSVTPVGNLASDDVQSALEELQGDVDSLNNSKISATEKGEPEGVATLDVDGKIPAEQLPAIAITDVYVVADNTARDALTVEEGDVAKVTADGKSYIYDGSGWILLNTDDAVAAHEADTTGVHGIADTSVLLTETNTKAVTNKTIDADLNTISNIDNSDIKAGANIDHSKMASLTASRVMVTDGSGVASSSSVTTSTLGYLDATSSVQTQLDAKVAKSSVTTKGDLIVATASATVDRLAAGANGLYLKTNSSTSTGLEWASASANLSVTSKTTTYTATTSEDVILCSTSGGAWTLTLPTAVGNSGKVFRIKKTTSDANVLTIDGNASETIDGSTTTTVDTQYESITIISDGSNWQLVSRDIPSIWTAFTPTINGTTSNPTKASSATEAAYWRRVGDSMEIVYSYVHSVSTGSAAGSGTYRWPLPSGYTIDSNKIGLIGNTGASVCGSASCYDGSAYYVGTVHANTTSYLVLFVTNAATSPVSPSSTAIAMNNGGARYSFSARVPISGWKA